MAIELKSLSKVNGFEGNRSLCELRMLKINVTRVQENTYIVKEKKNPIDGGSF